MKVENWNGHEIRFVEKEPSEWWAVLADVTEALGINQASPIRRRLPKDVISNHPLKTKGGMQNFLVVSEFGLYKVIFSSRKKEAKDFKRWVFEVIKDQIGRASCRERV